MVVSEDIPCAFNFVVFYHRVAFHLLTSLFISGVCVFGVMEGEERIWWALGLLGSAGFFLSVLLCCLLCPRRFLLLSRLCVLCRVSGCVFGGRWFRVLCRESTVLAPLSDCLTPLLFFLFSVV